MEQESHRACEAFDVLEEVYKELHLLPYNKDLRVLYNNLYDSATMLSQLEVYVRRTHSRSRYAMQHKKLLKEFNTGITLLKHYLLIARIMA